MSCQGQAASQYCGSPLDIVGLAPRSTHSPVLLASYPIAVLTVGPPWGPLVVPRTVWWAGLLLSTKIGDGRSPVPKSEQQMNTMTLKMSLGHERRLPHTNHFTPSHFCPRIKGLTGQLAALCESWQGPILD